MAGSRAVDPFPGRLSPIPLPSGAVVLRDDYNGSHPVLEAALGVLRAAAARRRILVLSDFSDFDGNRKRRLRYVAERCPDYLVIFPEWFPRLAARADLIARVYAVRLERNEVAGAPEMVVYRLRRCAV